MKQATDCKICSNLRPISLHLYELAVFCNYLDNVFKYDDGETTSNVRTIVIGDWLKLASQLDKVEINTWKYADESACYCGTAADQIDSDSKHFTNYSTALTKFIFVCSSLEEVYRFVSNIYDSSIETHNIPSKKRMRRPSMKASALIDRFHGSELPIHFNHLTHNFKAVFKAYELKYSPSMSGMETVPENAVSYSLHLIRNLRNHVAHGVFPLVDNPDYYISNEYVFDYLHQLLFYACRLSAIYIQMLIGKFNNGFESYDYDCIEGACGEDFEYFLENCTLDYLSKLHVLNKFSFADGFI